MTILPTPITQQEFAGWIDTIAKLPPEQFKLAIKILEAKLTRTHALRMEQERNRAREAVDARAHRLYAWGLGAGFFIVVGMIAASIVIGVRGYPWLSAALSGPGVVALASLFVLRKSAGKATTSGQESAPVLTSGTSEPTP